MKKKKIFIIAYACEPNKSSEPGVGWNFSREISKVCDTFILTRTNNKNQIEKNLQNHNGKFLYYDLPKIFSFLKKKIPLGTQLYYLLWQIGAYKFAKKYIKNNNLSIDLVHHLTFGISWLSPPSFLIKEKFVWGPIGGGDFVPLKVWKEMDLRSILNEILYIIINTYGKYSLFSFLNRKKASAIIFRTKSVKKKFPKTSTKILHVISEAAIDRKPMEIKIKHEGYINAIYVGRMTYWKGAIYAVKGFHEFLKLGGKGKLELLGEGPELEKIKQYIIKNNLEKNIILNGFVSRGIVFDKLQKSNVLIHPSFRDGGSWAIMEAMSFGLPVICLNSSGPKDMVTNQCGILIDIKTSEQIVKDIGKSLYLLLKDKELFHTLSLNAFNRIRNKYNWEKRREEILKVYSKILNL